MGAWGTCLEIAPQGRIRISFQFESESAIGSSLSSRCCYVGCWLGGEFVVEIDSTCSIIEKGRRGTNGGKEGKGGRLYRL